MDLHVTSYPAKEALMTSHTSTSSYPSKAVVAVLYSFLTTPTFPASLFPSCFGLRYDRQSLLLTTKCGWAQSCPLPPTRTHFWSLWGTRELDTSRIRIVLEPFGNIFRNSNLKGTFLTDHPYCRFCYSAHTFPNFPKLPQKLKLIEFSSLKSLRFVVSLGRIANFPVTCQLILACCSVHTLNSPKANIIIAMFRCRNEL